MIADGPSLCEHCRFPNAARATFCEQCGQPLLRTCPKCGARASASARFCVECGTALGAPGSAPGPLTSPVAYTPSHLAERILTSRAAIEGERKQVTVLFADLRSSLELLTNQDPEEARRLLDAVVQHMMDAVHHYEGTVNQVLGDGIMALFGAPLGHEDHAVRACYAALRMQEQVRRFAENVWRSEGVSIQIRVGLNSGEVVVRSISTDLHIDYSAIGSTTHLAARMEQLAIPGTILATADTFRLVEGLVEVTPLGPITVKGLASPINVYEITGPGRARSRFQAASGRGFTQFVGRESEMEQLHRIRRHLEDGHGQVVGIVGEPGVGKSRLLMEFNRAPDLEGTLVLESAATPYGRDGLHGPITSLLRSYFGIEDRDDPSTAARTSDGRTGRDRRFPARDTTGVAGIAQRAGRRQRMARPGRLAAAPADPRCGQAAAVSRESAPSRGRGGGRRAVGRPRDAGTAGRAGRHPAGGAGHAPRGVSARVSACVGQPGQLHPAPPRPAVAVQRGDTVRLAGRDRFQPGPPQGILDRADRGQSVLSRGVCALLRGDGSPHRTARRPPAGARDGRHSVPVPDTVEAVLARAHRPALARAQALAAVGGGHREGGALRAPRGSDRRSGRRHPTGPGRSPVGRVPVRIEDDP